MYFVYVDWTTGVVPRPFYVGKGDARRLKRSYRNHLHDSISKKYGIDRRVVFESEHESEAFDRERSLIAEHRTYVYGEGYVFGANFTEGGEGQVAIGDCQMKHAVGRVMPLRVTDERLNISGRSMNRSRAK